MATDTKKNKKNVEAKLETARTRFRLAEEAESEVRQLALEDLKFRAGEQWPETVKLDRDLDNRPCLVINRIPQFIRQVTNDQRQNRPSIKVHPVDDHADVETAKIYQGLIRHIEYNSGADVAYDTAFDSAATMGFGYFRVIADYVHPHSFEQELLIKRIRNPFSVYFDPNSKEPDGSDAAWAFIHTDIPHDEYKAEYGDTELARMEDWSSIGDAREGWVTKSTCRVAEYFYREFKNVKLCLLNDGSTVERSELESQFPDGEIPEGLVIDERTSRVPVIMWCKINGVEIIEEREWPGRWIPIIPVYGDELDVEGKRILEGIVRHAKDSQRMYNYWASTETETIALAPRAPFIAAEGQIPREYEAQWRTANKKSHAYLPYKPVDHMGQLVPPPQRNVFEAPVAAITNARLNASEDLKATTGIYDAALGAKSNESSGVAIARRNMQSQTSNFHLIDNLTRSIRHCGRILIDLIPKIYDTARAARIIGEEGQQEIVRINEEFVRNGDPVIYNLGVGKYDVAVETGPSFATKRMEAAASMESLIKAAPQVMQVAGDLLVKNLDWPGASEIAERLKKTIPPELQDAGNKQEQIPAQAQAQMQQMNQMIEQLTQSLTAANETLNQKRLELESKERIEFAKMETDLEKEKLKLMGAHALDSIQAQIQDLEARLQLVGFQSPLQVPGQPMPQPMQPQNQSPMAAGDPLEGLGAVDMNQPMPTGGPQTPGQPMEY